MNQQVRDELRQQLLDKGYSSKYTKRLLDELSDHSSCLEPVSSEDQWALENDVRLGTVKEIVFEKGKSPLNGDLPLYVVVDFPLYRGPPWDKDNPKHIPIPMCESSCRYHCCLRRFCPLDLCFARTIHKFQGLQAGPPIDGKQQHLYHSVVIDPDIKSFEQTHSGLFYTAISRGTTLGDDSGLRSAVYFTGHHLTQERIQKLTKCLTGDKECKKVTKRRAWVSVLDNNTIDTSKPNPKFRSIQRYFNQSISYDKIHNQKILHTF